MKLKKTFVVSLVLLTLAVLSIGSGYTAEKNEIRIGVLLPLTGYISHFGLMQEAALKMIEKEIKDKGGVGGFNVRFIMYDTACKPKDAILMAQKLISSDQVHCILGPFLSTECEQVFPVVNTAKVPIITGSSAKPGLTKASRPWTFRMIMTSDKINNLAITWWVKKHDIKSVVILTDIKSKVSETYGKAVAPEILKKLGIQIKDNIDFVTEDVDFSAQVTKAKAANPDALVLAGEYTPAANLAREAAKQGLKLPLLGDVPIVTDQYIKLAGTAAEGTCAPTDFWFGNPDPAVRTFIVDFKKQFGKDVLPHTTTAGMYNTLLVTRHLIESQKLSGKPEDLQKDREKIRDGLANLKDFQGLSKISMNEEGEALMDYYILIVRDGQWVRGTSGFMRIRGEK
jgi:branched-chain amino acid transport system substrate-binding protein